MDRSDRIKRLQYVSREIRKKLVQLASQHTIHIGGDLSSVEIVTVLWQDVMRYNPENPSWEGRDRFILSKGHGAATVYFNQEMLGFYQAGTVMDNYAGNEQGFGMAPCREKNRYFESSATGSLGLGLSVGAGIASALQKKGNRENKVYVVLGDGELQEGCNWEAIMYAGQMKLSNLIAIIDNNGLQFDGKTKDIVDVGDIGERFADFGWQGCAIDGHDVGQLLDVLDSQRANQTAPFVIDAHTIKGKGVPYMENNYVWHAGRVKDLDATLKMMLPGQEGDAYV